MSRQHSTRRTTIVVGHIAQQSIHVAARGVGVVARGQSSARAQHRCFDRRRRRRAHCRAGRVVRRHVDAAVVGRCVARCACRGAARERAGQWQRRPAVDERRTTFARHHRRRTGAVGSLHAFGGVGSQRSRSHHHSEVGCFFKKYFQVFYIQ